MALASSRGAPSTVSHVTALDARADHVVFLGGLSFVWGIILILTLCTPKNARWLTEEVSNARLPSDRLLIPAGARLRPRPSRPQQDRRVDFGYCHQVGAGLGVLHRPPGLLPVHLHLHQLSRLWR